MSRYQVEINARTDSNEDTLIESTFHAADDTAAMQTAAGMVRAVTEKGWEPLAAVLSRSVMGGWMTLGRVTS